MIDKNGNKRWVNDKTLENARARMNEMHKKGIARPPTRKKKPPPVEVQLKEVLEKQEQNKNNLSEEFIKKYQEDLMNVVKAASLNAVEEYDTKRKARKAEKKAQQRAEIVQSQMRSKLEGLQRPVKYGQVGYFDSCWD
jgi:SH3-like domain-containing protein